MLVCIVAIATLTWLLVRVTRDSTRTQLSRATDAAYRAATTAPHSPTRTPAKEGLGKVIARTPACADPACQEQQRLEQVQAALEKLVTRLTPEESALVEKYGPEGLHQAIGEMQQRYLEAPDATRADAEAAYYRVLNLAAKLAAPTAQQQRSAAETASYQAYHDTLQRQQEYLARLPETQADEERVRIKDTIFQEKLAQEQAAENLPSHQQEP